MSREVTLSNYSWKFEEIEDILESAQLVSIDTEATGFSNGYDNKKQFGSFDTSTELYLKIKKNISQFTILQFGLTAFCYNRECNKYLAHSYVFYAYPRAVAKVQKVFLVQGSVLEFLSQTGFDFNKTMYKGLSHLNLAEEAGIRECLAQGMFMSSEECHLSREEAEAIQAQCSMISLWLTTAKAGDEWKVEDFNYSNKNSVYLLTKEIHRRFLEVWTKQGDDNSIMVVKVPDHDRGRLVAEASKENIFESQLIEHYIGVSRIWKYLAKMKKPIVACDPLRDLMMLYQQFHNPLPNSYQSFKKELHGLFPHVYDTKYIGYAVQELCDRRGISLDDSNGLSLLKTYFVRGRGAALPSCSPPVELANSARDVPSNIEQETGWDSYYTGCCLLRMAHFLAKENGYGCGVSEQPLNMTVARLFLVGIKIYKNRIHIAPANASYMCLDEPDPVPSKPRKLLVTSMSRFATNAEWIAKDLSKAARQTVDVRMISTKQALVTVNSLHAARQVAGWCETQWSYQVQEYREVRVLRSLIMGSALGLTCALAVKMYRYLA